MTIIFCAKNKWRLWEELKPWKEPQKKNNAKNMTT
jgi:hypothetical protein